MNTALSLRGHSLTSQTSWARQHYTLNNFTTLAGSIRKGAQPQREALICEASVYTQSHPTDSGKQRPKSQSYALTNTILPNVSTTIVQTHGRPTRIRGYREEVTFDR